MCLLIAETFLPPLFLQTNWKVGWTKWFSVFFCLCYFAANFVVFIPGLLQFVCYHKWLFTKNNNIKGYFDWQKPSHVTLSPCFFFCLLFFYCKDFSLLKNKHCSINIKVRFSCPTVLKFYTVFLCNHIFSVLLRNLVLVVQIFHHLKNIWITLHWWSKVKRLMNFCHSTRVLYMCNRANITSTSR